MISTLTARFHNIPLTHTHTHTHTDIAEWSLQAQTLPSSVKDKVKYFQLHGMNQLFIFSPKDSLG
jgi:hypothetical protein